MVEEKGYIAKCIDVGRTVNLKMEAEYYVYPNGKDTFYVSKYSFSKKAFMGCYSRNHFEIKGEIPNQEPKIEAAEDLPTEEIVLEDNYEQISLF